MHVFKSTSKYLKQKRSINFDSAYIKQHDFRFTQLIRHLLIIDFVTFNIKQPPVHFSIVPVKLINYSFQFYVYNWKMMVYKTPQGISFRCILF